jgi:hypothetical protein
VVETFFWTLGPSFLTDLTAALPGSDAAALSTGAVVFG